MLHVCSGQGLWNREKCCGLNGNCARNAPWWGFTFPASTVLCLFPRALCWSARVSIGILQDSNNLLKWILMKTGRYLFLVKGQYVLDNRCPNIFREYLGNKYFLMLFSLLFLLQSGSWLPLECTLLSGCYYIHLHSMVNRCQIWLSWFCREQKRNSEGSCDLIKVTEWPKAADALNLLSF